MCGQDRVSTLRTVLLFSIVISISISIFIVIRIRSTISLYFLSSDK